MRSRLIAALACFCAFAAAPAWPDSADEAFWKSVGSSGNPAELNAYLQAFPQGQFADLARVRLRALGTAAQSTAAAPSTTPVIITHQMLYRATDTVAVQVDTRSFKNGTNFRVAVMSADAPDAVSDQRVFQADSMAVDYPVMRLVLPPGPAGHDEIRLYYIAPFDSAYRVAARFAVEFAPGAPGAMSLHQMTLSIARAGLDRFLADFENRTWVLEGQFGGSVTNAGGVRHVGVDYEDITPDLSDADRLPTQVLCEMSPKQPDLDARINALRKGEDVVLIGHGATLKDADKDAFLVHDCVFAN